MSIIDQTVQLVRAGTIHNVEEWEAHIATMGASLEDEVRCLMACAIKVPEHAVLISTLFADWRGRQYPVVKKLSTGNTGENAAPYTCSIKVDDIIFLQARIDSARSMLLRYGSWWKVKSGRPNGLDYLLESIFCKGKTQKRSEPKGKIEYLTIGRKGDNMYDVTQVIQFPCSPDQIP